MAEYIFLLAGAALAGAVVVGINPTRRGAELAGDITTPTASWSSPIPTNVALLDGLDLGLGRDRVLIADGADYRAPAGRSRTRGGPPPVAARRPTTSTC